MKVLALNSSPRVGGQSKTELMLNHLVAGMRDADADVEVVNLRDKRIRYCKGCLSCFTKTPGVCIHHDDMAGELLPKWLAADLVVYATPLYNYAMTATLKAFIERTLPAMEPFFEIHEGRMYHPVRNKFPASVVLSVSGMPDRAHFDALSAHVRYFFGSPGRKLVAEIYRPAAEMLGNTFTKEETQDILDATEQAGRELIRSMQVFPQTMARITQPVGDPETFAAIANIMWKTCISEGVTTKEFVERKMVPRPDSLESFMILFSYGINAGAAGEKTAVMQFMFSGEIEDACHFIVDHQRVEAKQGTCDNPDVTIETPFEIWLDIMTGKADGQQMFMAQKYKVTGDLSLMLALLARP